MDLNWGDSSPQFKSKDVGDNSPKSTGEIFNMFVDIYAESSNS